MVGNATVTLNVTARSMFVDCLPGYRISTGVHQGYDSATVYCNDDDTWGLVSPCTRTAFTVVKLAFHGADTDTDTDSPNTATVFTSDTRYFLARILARISVSVSVSASWNYSFTKCFYFV